MAGKNYSVSRTQTLAINANSAHDARAIAEAAFAYGQNSDGSLINPPLGIWGRALSLIRTWSVRVEEDC